MITEDYVSFEVAKLLKEKGFASKVLDDGTYAEECRNSYDIYTGDFLPHCVKHGGQVNAPTLQVAMKWLRNTFHLEIYPFHDAIQENNDWWYRIERYSKGCGLTEHESDVIYKTYEEASEAAIKYCLENLI